MKGSITGAAAHSYAAQWQQFAGWCEKRGCAPLPTAPPMVAAYLAERAQAGAAVASIGVMTAAIAFGHRAAGLAFDRTDPTLKLVLEGIRRVHVRPQAQAEPLTGRLLSEILTTLGTTSVERRDGALLSVLYLFALRASEAAALDWARFGTGRGRLSLTDERAEIALLGSKARPDRAEMVAIPSAANPLALAAIRAWVDHAKIGSGEALLRPVTASGSIRGVRLDAPSVSGIVKRALERYFLREGVTATDAAVQGRSWRPGVWCRRR